MMWSNALALASSASWSLSIAGRTRFVASIATATWIAVGNTSLDDWPMLTWSFGWTGFLEPISPPSASMARLEMTSLTFMLVWVPEPVW